MIDKQGKFEICMTQEIFCYFDFWKCQIYFFAPCRLEWICDEWLRKLWYLILQAEEENISTCRRPTIRFSLTSNRGECIIIQKRFFPRWLKFWKFLFHSVEIEGFFCWSEFTSIQFWWWQSFKNGHYDVLKDHEMF